MGRRGRPITRPTSKGPKVAKRISFNLEPNVYVPLAHYCVDADCSIQDFVVQAIRERLGRVKR